MGVQKDKILEILKDRKWLAPEEDYKTLLKYFGGKAKMKKTLADWKKNKPPFKHFHKSWSKQRVLDVPLWKGDTWEQVIDFCELTKIKPKEVMNWAAGRKINKTDEKTIQIAMLFYSSPSKLSLRGQAIHLRNKLIEIDKNLERRPNEEDKNWHQRLYLRVHNALGRTD